MNHKRILIKLGGASLQDESILSKVAACIEQYRSLGYQVVLVHGGGPAINQELSRRNIDWSFVKGQRVTTPEMMDVIEMVLSGSINPKIVKFLNARGLFSFGFSGVDGPTLLCSRASSELGMVGVVEQVNSRWIEDLLSQQSAPIPVIAPLGTNTMGESFNVNADWAAARLASALKVQQMIFLTDQKGIFDQRKIQIKDISQLQLEELIDTEAVSGGMYTKALTILHALENGIQSVRVLNANDCLEALVNDRIGTWCLNERTYQKIQQKAKVETYAAV
jgi:acetylglutamate kinase